MMKRSVVVIGIGICLSVALCMYGVVANAPQAPEGDDDTSTSSDDLRLPPIILFGDKGQILYDLHATLNAYFDKDKEKEERWDLGKTFVWSDGKRCWGRGEKIDLSEDMHLWKPGESFDWDEPHTCHLKDGGRLNIPRGWFAEEQVGGFVTFKKNEIKIKSIGVYGEQTYLLVTLLQIDNNLRPTGEVDAVTLDKMTPLHPASRPVLNFITSIVKNVTEKGLTEEDVLAAQKDRVKPITTAIAIPLIFLISAFAFRVARYTTKSIATFFERRFQSRGYRSRTASWFDQLGQERFFLTMAHLAPACLIFLAQFVFPDYWVHEYEPGPIWAYPGTFFFWNAFFGQFGLAYIIYSLLLLALGFVNTCEVMWGTGARAVRDDQTTDVVEQNGAGRLENEPIRNTALSGIIGFARGAVKTVGVVLICAALVGQSPLTIVGGLGAFMAVIMLVFRDSILGLVASVNIVIHKTVQVGDWIEMPKYGVDGDVVSISLTTIKVCNFDKTIVSIPTYSVMADSFKNWRGMRDAGGRRIKRAIYIDMNTIRPVDMAMCERFEAMNLLTEYIQGKRDDLREHLLENDVLMSPANSRWLTNIGTYRAYLERYLEQHASISPNLTCLVRQLKPTSAGLPIEVYAFANETNWRDYERIQADIFDHALSVLREFELRVYQSPSELNSIDFELPPIDHTPWHIGLERLQYEVERENQMLAEKPRASVAAAVKRMEKMAHKIADELGDSVEFQIGRNDRTITAE